MRLIILGSGSSGNALYIESGATSVLVDVGLSAKETARRMTEAGLDPTRLSAIVVTHEHADHIKGVRVCPRPPKCRSSCPKRRATSASSPRRRRRHSAGAKRSLRAQPFQVGSLEFHPFTIPHDGVDTFAFTVESEGVKVGIVTDLGYITQLVAERLRGCDSGDDRIESRPRYVESRAVPVVGQAAHRQQHGASVERRDGAMDARRLRRPGRILVLAHLSRHCNHPELARLSALQALD